MKKLLKLLAMLGLLFALVGCNTVDGLGEDIEDAGESMQDAAN